MDFWMNRAVQQEDTIAQRGVSNEYSFNGSISEEDKLDILQALGLPLSVQAEPTFTDLIASTLDDSRSSITFQAGTNSMGECHGPDWMSEQDVVSALICLYATHFHPIFPILDDYIYGSTPCQISTRLRKRSELLFTAVLFVAFSYVRGSQLRRWSYGTIHENQSRLFLKAKGLYHRQKRNTESPDHVLLCQVSFLLSNWGPYAPEDEKSRVWINRAIRYARNAGLHEINSRYCNAYVVWACCLARERLLGLSTSLTSQRYSSFTRYTFTEAMEKTESSRRSTNRSKLLQHERAFQTAFSLVSLDAFLLLVRLSDIIQDAFIAQDELLKRDREDAPENISSSDLGIILSLIGMLEDWENDLIKVTPSYGNTPSRRTTMVFEWLSVVGHAVSIYVHSIPISIHRGGDIMYTSLLETSFSSIKRVTARLSRSLGVFLKSNCHEDTPLMFASWLPCPIFVCMLSLYTDNSQDKTEVLNQLRSFLTVLYILRERFSGAEFVTQLVDAFMRGLPLRLSSIRHFNVLAVGPSMSEHRWQPEPPPSSDSRSTYLSLQSSQSIGEQSSDYAGINLLAWGIRLIRESFATERVGMFEANVFEL